MSFRLPAYLLLSRHHVFYFRVAVPVPLRSVLSRSEIRVSLRTSDRRAAISDARKWKMRYDEWFETIADMNTPAPKLFKVYVDYALWHVWFEVPVPSGRFQVLKNIKIPPGRDISEFDLTLNEDGSVRVTEIMTNTPPNACEFNIKWNADGSLSIDDVPNDVTEEQAQGIGKAVKRMAEELRDHIRSPDISTGTPEQRASQDVSDSSERIPNEFSSRMSNVLEIYRKEKLAGNRWNEKTNQQNFSRLQLICLYLNDPDVSKVRPLDITNMKQDLHYLPKNLPIEGLSNRRLHLIIKLQKRRERAKRPLEQRISVVTLNAYLSRLSGFLEWCVDQGYADLNAGKNKTIRRSKSHVDDEDDSRVEWEESDLKAIFESKFFSDHMYAHPYQYWLPILAIFTGARINELSQLHTGDIIFDDESETWCVKFFPDRKKGQKLKNEKAKRLIPLNHKVIDLGFIEFLQERKKSARKDESIQLFTGLTLQRDGYGKNSSRWFNEVFKRYLGYKPNDGKVFHSFRRNVISQLKQFLLTLNFGKIDIVTKAIVGHKGDVDITWDYYASDFRPAILKRVIDHIRWPVNFSPYKHPDDQSAKRLRTWLKEK